MEQMLTLGLERQTKFQTINITVPSGSPVNNIVQASQQLDREYNKIVFIGFFEKTDGGIPNQYDVGAKTQRQVWVDPVNINAWRAESGVGPMQKYISVNIPYGSGDSFYAQVSCDVSPSSDLIGQMVLVLGKDLTELPKG